jgi:two-component system response regulator YesN
VIFLTGFDDFDYAQQAIRGGGYDFILKTEGEERILESLHEAIRDISFKLEEEQLLQKAKRQMQLALPALQKEYLLGLIEDGKLFKPEERKARFAELDIPLQAELPVMLIVCRVDEWYEAMNRYDKALLLYAVQNIAEEMWDCARLTGFSCHPNQLLWFLQPKTADIRENWQDMKEALRDSAGPFQSVCKSMLKLPVSLFLSGGYVPWEEAGSQWHKLRALLHRGIGQNREIILFDSIPPSKDASDHASLNEYAQFQKRIRLLETCLERGQKEEFVSLYLDLSGQADALSPLSRRQLCHAVSSMLLGHMIGSGLADDIEFNTALEQLLAGTGRLAHVEWDELLLSFAQGIFERRSKEQIGKSIETVEQLKLFIQERLDEDLSLTRLSEIVYLNTSYLSRLFKQIAGVSVTEYIMGLRISKAKELLRETDFKIQDIARKVGLEAPAYFIRLFKKETNLTPMEYRDSR